ncbi:glutamate racemase [Barrientosiimonas marina]|uniref:Glutamate racemase n=1 Tax=Lentibacillus kimchii TaxID=1542911 RepID=A0ABW2UVJ4_9BACI
MSQNIGVVDSGVGGLTVVHELMRQLPGESLIYLGDTLRCPYGPRSETEIKRFTWEMVRFLLPKSIKMLVVACNTATAFTLKELQEQLPIPVIGVIKPGARAAIKYTENSHIGVIGTEGTIRSQAYASALKQINPEVSVDSLACPSFVPMVEQGVMSGDNADNIVSQSLQPLQRNNRIDTLILGCTHYPLIKQTIQEVMGHNIAVISSSEETAREASTILEFYDQLVSGTVPPAHRFYTTGDIGHFAKMTESIFKTSVDRFQAVTIEQAII